jgi:uncharacterized protein
LPFPAGHDRKYRCNFFGEDAMKYFVAFLKMKDLEKNVSFRQQHIDFLGDMEKEKKVYARGRFMDESGGMVIYVADSFKEAEKIAASDPYVTCGARILELHEWDVKITPV